MDCGRCGEENPDRARFCLACGSPLRLDAPDETRKVITVLFADLVDSTGHAERVDPETLRACMGVYFDALRQVTERHGGTVEKFIGDAVMAVFGVPAVHEDDALRAIRAGVEMQDCIAELSNELEARLGGPLAIRVGINTGEVIAGGSLDDPTGLVGDPINTAARLEKVAPPGGIVIGEPTFRVVRAWVSATPLGKTTIEGKELPVLAYRVDGVSDHTQRRLDAPLVGRNRELDALRHALDRAIEERSSGLFTLLGAAGVGKSRLARELRAEISGRVRVLTGRCLPYGDGITFWPIGDAVSEAAQISDLDSHEDALVKLAALLPGDDGKLIANLIGQLLGFGQRTAGQEEIFWAVRRFFAMLAEQQPLVVVFDDIHWGEPTFLDLVDHLVEWEHDAPLLIICLARRELLESRPTWGGGKLNSTTVLLDALRDDDARRLFDALLEGIEGIDEILPRILEAAGGNPLFLEEMVGMLIDEGLVTERDGRWIVTGNISQLKIPPTIHALLAARLDQLPRDERAVLEVAAVMGKVFASDAVKMLSGKEPGTLDTLARKGLIRRDPGDGDEETYRFRHIMIRDAAYQGIPKERRADLHQRYAQWLEEVLAQRAVEYEEIIGYHLEQAFRLADEVGSSLANASLAARAATRLAAAAQRAGARDDLGAALTLFERAEALLPEGHEQRPYLLIEIGQIFDEQGEYGRSEGFYLRALELATPSNDRKARAHAELHLEESYIHSRGHRSNEELQAILQRLITTFTELDDHVGRADAWRLLAYLYDTVGDSSRSKEAFVHSVHHASESGDERREIAYRRAQIQSLAWGPTPIAELAGKTETYLEWAHSSQERRSIAIAYGILATIEAARGRIEEARALISRQHEIYEELGMHKTRAWSVFEFFAAELWAGDVATTESELVEACDLLRRLEEHAVLPTILALLADVRFRQDRLEEAEALVDEASSLATEDDALTVIKCRSVLGKIRARQGEGDEAIRLAEEGVKVADGTEYLDWRAFAWVDLATVYRALDRTEEARSALETAKAYLLQKGLEFPATRMDREVAALSPAP